jgi:hypothetical protein
MSHVSRLKYHVSSITYQDSRIKSQESRSQESRISTQGASNQVTRIPPSVLTTLGERCARTTKKVREKDSRYELAREIKGLQERLGRELSFPEHMAVFNAWYNTGKAYMEESYDKQLAASLYEVTTVKKPKGGHADFQQLIRTVANIPVDQLPVIPAFPAAPEAWLRAAALHRELARQANGGVYALSYRDAACALEGWGKDFAGKLNHALTKVGVIEQVDAGAPKGKGRGAAKRTGVAAQWRYLLPLYDEDDEDVEVF